MADGSAAGRSACDTLVALGGRIFGKPADEAHARATLGALSGHTHEVVGGLWLVDRRGEQGGIARTRVTFREIEPRMLDWFVARGEWQGRSGGYAIQGGAAPRSRPRSTATSRTSSACRSRSCSSCGPAFCFR